jgi:hypothetical protein
MASEHLPRPVIDRYRRMKCAAPGCGYTGEHERIDGFEVHPHGIVERIAWRCSTCSRYQVEPLPAAPLPPPTLDDDGHGDARCWQCGQVGGDHCGDCHIPKPGEPSANTREEREEYEHERADRELDP